MPRLTFGSTWHKSAVLYQNMAHEELTGGAAVAAAIEDAAARVAFSFPGAPATRVSLALERSRVAHRWCTNEAVATTLGLGAAMLDRCRAAVIWKHVGANVASDALQTGAAIREYRSGLVIVEGLDQKPKTSQNAQDNRPLWRELCVPALEPSTPQEAYDLTRFAFELSEAIGGPVVVRGDDVVLSTRGLVSRRAADPMPAAPGYRRETPFVCTAGTFGHHDLGRRALCERMTRQIELAPSSAVDGAVGVISAGHVGPRGSTKRPHLRLVLATPLPERALVEFMRPRTDILVAEEGGDFLRVQLEALAHRHGLATRITRAEQEHLSDAAPSPALPALDGLVQRACADLSRTPGAWARMFELARPSMPRFTAGDPRALLFQQLRALERPTLIATDPGVTGVLGIADGWVDAKLQMGGAAPLAGALSLAESVEGEAGKPLAVAVIGDTNYYHSEINGVLDNAIAGRDVLHVIVVNRKSEMTSGVRTPALSDEALVAQLRLAGCLVEPLPLAETAETARALGRLAVRTGPRALVLFGEGRPGQERDD